jgi:hypothetical protein
LAKFNNRSKKSKENLENTLGEREPLGFEDPKEKGSQISKKPKGFSGEEPNSHRESPWPPQEMEWNRKNT